MQPGAHVTVIASSLVRRSAMTATVTAKPSTQRRTASPPHARTDGKREPHVIAKPTAMQRGVGVKSRPTPVAPPAPVALGSYSFHRDSETVRLPMSVTDLASFRRWAKSEESPDKTPVFFLCGEVWIDMSKEQFFSHNQLMKTISRVLSNLETAAKGRYIPEGMLLSNELANLSGNPDGMFVSNDSFREQRVRLVDGASSGYVELEGTPDMVLEVVSDSSVVKDNQTLRDLYWKAGIPEYWIVDGRGEEVSFTILKQTARGYSAVRNGGGWLKSAVFGKSFRLTRRLDELGHPDFVLDVK